MSAAVVVLVLVVAAGGGVLLVPAVLRLAQRRGGVSATSSQAVLRGGLIIGILERLATAGCVLLGQPEGIAVVVAVKGLGRYPELRGSVGGDGAKNLGAAVSERFIIGTLTSLIWAVAVGALGRWLLITILV